jgi:putative spermidine/putrescine transport system substrate-binding protein
MTMRTTRRQLIARVAQGGLVLGGVALLAACGQAGGSGASGAGSSATPAASTPAAAGAANPTPAPTSAPAGQANPTTAPAQAGAGGELTLYLGGDVNIRDLWTNVLAPAYRQVQPATSINVVFDEHALGEQAVFDKLAAAKQANTPSGVDLWEATGRLQIGGEAGIIQKVSTAEIPNLDKVPADTFNRYGGYGTPYRASSVVLAYNSQQVPQPPTTVDDLIAWIKGHDGQFTYNPPDKGGSGGSFVTRMLEQGIPPDQLTFFQTQYDESKEVMWEQGWATMKDLHPHIYNNGFYPAGNIPVLQTLGKGAISMAPVWSDQSLSYIAQKLLPAETKLIQVDPPFAGSAAYLGIPSDSQHKEAAYALLNWLLTPEPQTLIVDKINGYPGLDWKYMPPEVQQKFADIAKAYSFDFSPKFQTDRNKLWYERVAGTPPPSG